jgi:hypothetical protein
MIGASKYPLKNQLTILLLAVFVLVKANPCYYILQYPASAGVSHITLLDARHTYNLLVKLDKSITENIDSKHVPEIKFTGMPFVFFFFGFSVFTLLLKPAVRSFSYTFSKNEACIGKCILRL